jgi:hypothetical protein
MKTTNIIKTYRDFSITAHGLGYSCSAINCFSCDTVESVQQAIDIYLDGDKDPQCKGPRVGHVINHPTYGNCKVTAVHGMGTIDVKNIYSGREYRITGLPMN